MKLRYTLRGAAELDKVLVYIEERSPQGTSHVQARIQAIDVILGFSRRCAGSGSPGCNRKRTAG